ncbi:MAG TPA: oligopeptide/dipeptide ABC transporter ATP-binding protein [Gemmatimonadales bacterium]
MTTADPLLVVDGLVKRFPVSRGWLRKPDTLHAVDGVSLAIPRGQTLGLVGESGSGKSTLSRCVVRLLTPDAGRIVFDGVEVLALDPRALRAFRRRIQIVFQDPFGSLNPRMRIGTAVREPIEIHHLAPAGDADDRVTALLREVGLDPSFAERYPHELSGGQRQRVCIARALAVEPECLVLDEPVSALDVSVQAQVLTLLRDLQARRGLTYLFIAHDLAVVRQMAQRVMVMYLGRIVEDALATRLYRIPRHPYTAALLSAVPAPDPTRRANRIVLPGEPPSPMAVPPGCAFHPRCPHPRKDTRCERESPALRDLDGTRVACHYAEEPARGPAAPAP